MEIGGDRVAGPDHDIARMDEAFGIDAAGRADRQQPGGRRARRAERLLVDRRAHAIEEGVARGEPLHQPLIAEIGIGHDRLAAVFGDDLLEARRGLGDRLVPGDARELARALRPDAAQGIEHAVGIVVMVVIVLELHAQPAAGHGVVFVAADLDQPAVLDLVDHGAGVGAVMRTPAEEGLALRLLVHGCTLPWAYRLLGEAGLGQPTKRELTCRLGFPISPREQNDGGFTPARVGST